MEENMAYVKFNPWWEFENLTKEFDKMVKTVSNPETRPRVEFGGFKPRVDIIEDEKNIYFEIEVPGVKKDDVKVSVDEDNILSVKGEKKFERKDEIKVCCRNERSFGDFERSFQLPELVAADKIGAKYENGMLLLTIPKLEPAKPKETVIDIK
ncbi:MAG: Hsp20/alpha crystallin family protein [Bacteroidetes bacterium]|nr:MAG: Hsp20/alpha crystallin family protein [Bacteroidota bacterium]